jgi:hypothetical protein
MAKKAKKQKLNEKQELVRRILQECSAKILQGVGAKSVGQQARKYWTRRGTRNIRKQVNNNVDWEKAKIRVLPIAKKMGKVAAALTGDKLTVIPPWAAKAAFEAVKHDPKCPPNPGIGRGGFCL